jgi:hypothetical protein
VDLADPFPSDPDALTCNNVICHHSTSGNPLFRFPLYPSLPAFINGTNQPCKGSLQLPVIRRRECFAFEHETMSASSALQSTSQPPDQDATLTSTTLSPSLPPRPQCPHQATYIATSSYPHSSTARILPQQTASPSLDNATRPDASSTHCCCADGRPAHDGPSRRTMTVRAHMDGTNAVLHNVDSLRLKKNDFEVLGRIGEGQFGVVSSNTPLS